MKKYFLLVLCLICSSITYSQPSIFSELQYPLSLIDCAGNLTALNPEFERVKLWVSSKQGEFHLIKADDVICDPPALNNSIYILKRDFTNISNFDKVKESIIKFTDLLPIMNSSNWDNKSMFIQTIKQDKEEIIFILYRINDKWIGFVRKLDLGLSSDEAYLNIALEKAKTVWGIKYIYWYGNETNKININSIAKKYAFEVFRRSAYVDNEFPSFIQNTSQLQSQLIEPKASVVFNSIPTLRDELINAGFSPDYSPEWEIFKNTVNENIKNKFVDKPSTVSDFKNELISGTSDVLLLVAHSDKISIYLGNQKIEIEEIKKWEERQIKSDKPRIAILLSCYAGEIEQIKTNWFFFQAQRESLTEVLLKKKYVDFIISPDHRISRDETLQVINEILKNPTIHNLQNFLKGWHAFVFTNTSKK